VTPPRVPDLLLRAHVMAAYLSQDWGWEIQRALITRSDPDRAVSAPALLWWLFSMCRTGPDAKPRSN
jgi:hypothetical protein